MRFDEIDGDVTNRLTRRGMTSRLVGAGVSLGMAIATADILSPDPAAAEVEADAESVVLQPEDSARNVIQPSDGGTVPLTLKGANPQAADLLQMRSAAGDVRAAINNDGSLVIHNPIRPSLQMYGKARGAAPGPRYLTQFGIGGSLPGLVTNCYVSINGRANEPFGSSSLNIAGRGTYMLGISSDVGPAPIVVIEGVGPIMEAYRPDGFRQVEWSPSGLLALRGAGTATAGPVADKVGDKIGLYGSTYGLGIQGSRFVAYLASSAKFAIRRAAGTGQRSSGADIITLGDNGDIELMNPGKGVILRSPDGRVQRRICIDNAGAIVAEPL
jgi:hypothetical protein